MVWKIRFLGGAGAFWLMRSPDMPFELFSRSFPAFAASALLRPTNLRIPMSEPEETGTLSISGTELLLVTGTPGFESSLFPSETFSEFISFRNESKTSLKATRLTSMLQKLKKRSDWSIDAINNDFKR